MFDALPDLSGIRMTPVANIQIPGSAISEPANKASKVSCTPPSFQRNPDYLTFVRRR
jgi:hypothetical protein